MTSGLFDTAANVAWTNELRGKGRVNKCCESERERDGDKMARFLLPMRLMIEKSKFPFVNDDVDDDVHLSYPWNNNEAKNH